MPQRASVCILVAVVFSIGTIGRGQSAVQIGDASAAPGKLARMPVMISAPTDVAALNLRLRYDPAVVTPLSVGRGPLATYAHLVLYQVPPETPGGLNVVMYPLSGATPFGATAGTVAELLFQVGENVLPGTSTDITFETPVSSALPSSDLSDVAGNSLAHTQSGGRLTITERENRSENWMLYR